MSPRPGVAGRKVFPAPSLRARANGTAFAKLNGGTSFFTRRTTQLTSADFGNPSPSPMRTRITCSTLVRSMTSARVCAKFSTMTMARAPASSSWCSSSRAV